MARYTVELRDIINSGINIFDFKYDFYDEMQRRDFEQKFIKHFYFREIGSETIDRFKWYLEDKMLTVFPYYNELFKSALIEYDVLDNYKLTETYERTYETTGDSRTTNNAVGRFTEEQGNGLVTTQTTTTEGGVTNKETTTTDTTGNTITNTEGQSRTETVNDGTSTVNVDGTVTNNSTENDSSDDVKRFSDTPAGRLNLSEADYLSSLEHNLHEGERTSTNTEKSESETKTVNHDEGSSETNDTGKSETDETGKTVAVHEGQTDSNEEQETVTKTDGTMTDEQISRNDSESRHLSENTHKEEYTIKRRGNIGVDTDSDAIEKHNRLQATLRRIELSFFEECNDLFMMVY